MKPFLSKGTVFSIHKHNKDLKDSLGAGEFTDQSSSCHFR